MQVGVTGGGRCGCRLGICNPSLTQTRDTGSRVLPVSVIESHTVSKPTTNDDHPPRHETGTTDHERLNDHNCPPSKSVNDKEHTHPLPTMTQNEYDHPRTTTADTLTMWDVHLNEPRTTTTHHTKRARPPTNDTNRPPSTQNPATHKRPQQRTKQLLITHESPPATRNTHSNHPQTTTAHHDKKQARPSPEK